MSAGSRALPRGRHDLTRAAVADSQRARLLEAAAEVAAAKGFHAMTVGDVVAAAAVSRRTFYEHFAGKQACFLAAHRAGLDLLLAAIHDAVVRLPREDWRTRTRVSIAAYLRALADRPAAAWAFTIEALGAGPEVLEQRARVMSRWVEQWRELHAIARAEDPGIPAVRDDDLLALVGGIEELVREGLRTRGAERLPELAGRIERVALRVLTGPR